MHCRTHRNLPPDVEPVEADSTIGPDAYSRLRPRLKWWWWIIVGAICLFAWWLLLAPVRAHMHDRPDLDQWLMSLYSKHRGGCCDKQEAETMADPDWRNFKDVPAGTCKPSDVNAGTGETTTHTDWMVPAFCVRLESPYDHTWTWWEVPESAIVDEPNRAGPALIWIFWSANRLPYIRCFLPGTLS